MRWPVFSLNLFADVHLARLEEPVAGPSRQAACAKSAAEGSGAAGLVTTTQDEHTDGAFSGPQFEAFH